MFDKKKIFEEQFWGMTERILKRMKDTEEARVELAQAQVQEVMAHVEAVMAVVQPAVLQHSEAGGGDGAREGGEPAERRANR